MYNSKVKAGMQNKEMHYFAPLSIHLHVPIFPKILLP